MATMGEDTGFEPNVMVVDRRTWGVLKNHEQIIDRIKFGQVPGSPAILNVAAVAAVLGVERLLIARGIRNTALEGATNVHEYILGKNALLAYSNPNPSIMTPSAGYTFSWTAISPGAGAAGQAMRRFRLERIKSDRVELEMAFDQKLVSADLGFFFLDTVS